MPEVENGFCCTISEEQLNYKCGFYDEDKEREHKMYVLRYYQNNSHFVKVEIDLSKAIQNLICPKCSEISLFPYASEEYRKYDCDDVYDYYIDTEIECGLCNFKQKLQSVFIRSKVE